MKSAISPRKEESSLLEDLLAFCEEISPFRINFEDLSGVLADVKDLALPERHRIHTCDFCLLAKSQRRTHADCIRNKMAVVRQAASRMAGFSGQCHLGITEFVEPLIYRGKVLGIFFFGPARIKGSETAARQRIEKYCRRRRLDPLSFFAQFINVPVIHAKDVEKHRHRLRLAAKLCCRILEAHGLPLERYRMAADASRANLSRLHPLVRAAMSHIRSHYFEHIRLADVANHLKCNPDYLCRIVRRHFGCGLGRYVNGVRIDRARHLIASGRFDMKEIAFEVGFSDQSYFNKVFRSLVGCTPGEYTKKGDRAGTPYEQGSVSPMLNCVHP